MEEQFGGLQKPYVGAATELALIFLDCTHRALRDWLRFNLEQQAMDVNRYMSRPQTASLRPDLKATNHQLETLYRASYVSMVISLNYFAPGGSSSDNKTESSLPIRPDLTCFALLYLAESAVRASETGFVQGEGAPKPHWWDQPWVGSRLKAERSSLRGNWEEPAAWLLGLIEWPEGLRNN